jgi:hypothetical protein
MSWTLADVERVRGNVHARVGAFFRNTVWTPHLTCAVCAHPVDGWELCFQCNSNRTQWDDQLADVVMLWATPTAARTRTARASGSTSPSSTFGHARRTSRVQGAWSTAAADGTAERASTRGISARLDTVIPRGSTTPSSSWSGRVDPGAHDPLPILQPRIALLLVHFAESYKVSPMVSDLYVVAQVFAILWKISNPAVDANVSNVTEVIEFSLQSV